jgi:hypothetical protein
VQQITAFGGFKIQNSRFNKPSAFGFELYSFASNLKRGEAERSSNLQPRSACREAPLLLNP